MSDEETASRQLFMDTSVKQQDYARQLNSCKQLIFTRDRSSRLADITLTQLDAEQASQTTVPLVTYASVGKMFLMKDVVVLKEEIKAQSAKDRREVNVLEKTREYLQKTVVDMQKQLSEMLDKREQQQQSC